MNKDYVVFDKDNNELGRYADKTTADFLVNNTPGSRLQYLPLEPIMEPKRKNFNVRPIIFSFVLILIVGLGFYITQNHLNISLNREEPIEEVEIQTNSLSINIDEIRNYNLSSLNGDWQFRSDGSFFGEDFWTFVEGDRDINLVYTFSDGQLQSNNRDLFNVGISLRRSYTEHGSVTNPFPVLYFIHHERSVVLNEWVRYVVVPKGQSLRDYPRYKEVFNDSALIKHIDYEYDRIIEEIFAPGGTIFTEFIRTIERPSTNQNRIDHGQRIVAQFNEDKRYQVSQLEFLNENLELIIRSSLVFNNPYSIVIDAGVHGWFNIVGIHIRGVSRNENNICGRAESLMFDIQAEYPVYGVDILISDNNDNDLCTVSNVNW